MHCVYGYADASACWQAPSWVVDSLVVCSHLSSSHSSYRCSLNVIVFFAVAVCALFCDTTTITDC